MTAIYQDPSQPIEARVSDLLAQMSLAEKIGQMMQLPALGDDYGHVTVNETLPIVVCEGNGDVCVLDADLERDTEDTLLCFL